MIVLQNQLYIDSLFPEQKVNIKSMMKSGNNNTDHLFSEYELVNISCVVGSGVIQVKPGDLEHIRVWIVLLFALDSGLQESPKSHNILTDLVLILNHYQIIC